MAGNVGATAPRFDASSLSPMRLIADENTSMSIDALAHEGGVDSGIDDEMRDVDVLRPELARHRPHSRDRRGPEERAARSD
jgi:hypothetical protein